MKHRKIQHHSVLETELVYFSEPETWWSYITAVTSMFILFSFTLFYPIFVPFLIVWLVSTDRILLFVVLVVISVSSLFWHKWVPKVNVADSWILESWRRYFSFRVYKEVALDSTTVRAGEKLLFTCVPHGVFPLSLPMMSGIVATNKIIPEWCVGRKHTEPRAAVANVLFYIPFLAPLLHWLGCVAADRTSITTLLNDRNVEASVLVPDGIAGAHHSHHAQEILFLRERRGFVRMAMEEGLTLVPMYCFGHTQSFTPLPWSQHTGLFYNWSRSLAFSFMFFWPIVPRRPAPMTVVMGEPFKVEKCRPFDSITDLDIRRVQTEYLKRVVQLFHKHKYRYDVQWEHHPLQVY